MFRTLVSVCSNARATPLLFGANKKKPSHFSGKGKKKKKNQRVQLPARISFHCGPLVTSAHPFFSNNYAFPFLFIGRFFFPFLLSFLRFHVDTRIEKMFEGKRKSEKCVKLEHFLLFPLYFHFSAVFLMVTSLALWRDKYDTIPCGQLTTPLMRI